MLTVVSNKVFKINDVLYLTSLHIFNPVDDVEHNAYHGISDSGKPVYPLRSRE